MAVLRIAASCAAAVLAGGCGLGWFGDDPGGADGLPVSGAGPYGKPDFDFDTPAEEPFVVVDGSGSLFDPAALPRPDGGVRLWFSRLPDQAVDRHQIWRAELPGVLELPDVGPEASMAATEPWEQGQVRAPSVIDVGDRLVMYFQGGVSDPAIGRAESTDGGATWTKDPANPVLVGATDPAAAEAPGQILLYFTRPGVAGIFRAVSTDGASFAADPVPVLSPRADPDAFDVGGVAEPFVLVEPTPAGAVHFAMFYTGADAGDVAIGYAGSFDGVVWQRFNGVEPILPAGGPTEHGPAAVVYADRALLFYDQLGLGRQRIGVALHP